MSKRVVVQQVLRARGEFVAVADRNGHFSRMIRGVLDGDRALTKARSAAVQFSRRGAIAKT